MAEPRILSRRFDGVVIGASAGGTEALSVLLAALPVDFRVPVFVVLHLPRDRPSLLVGIFQAKCRLRVVEALDKEPIEDGTVYFAAPDYHLLLDEGPQLALSADELVQFSRPSIDVLFESAASLLGERLIGIILTGASTDGAEGLHAVHMAGGMTIVQEPSTAKIATMPAAALRKVPQARVLELDQIAEFLRLLRDEAVE